jgi:hypothetical protein
MDLCSFAPLVLRISSLNAKREAGLSNHNFAPLAMHPGEGRMRPRDRTNAFLSRSQIAGTLTLSRPQCAVLLIIDA